ncbi:MAG: Dna2/Cas4 domain-containing protein [Candidatus Pacearchaeota archaeon]
MIDFDKLIDNHLAKEFRPKIIGRYYPSEIANCLRKTWFSYKIPKPLDTKVIKIFQIGNMLHEFVTNVLKNEKNKEIEFVKSEIPIEVKIDDFIIAGRVDNLVLVKLNEINQVRYVLVEVKSTKVLPEKHKKEHEAQLQFYMQVLGITKGIILYIQKDNLETRAFNIDYNKELAEIILERFRELHRCLLFNKLPRAEAKQDKEKQWMCSFCAWKEECEKIR